MQKLLKVQVRQKQVASFVFWLLLTQFLAGCSIEASITSLLGDIKKPPSPKSNGAEIVSGSLSSVQKTTLSGYYVTSSAGVYTDQIAGRTPSGYRVYTTVHGQMISEDER